jgi:hypothetical protein
MPCLHTNLHIYPSLFHILLNQCAAPTSDPSCIPTPSTLKPYLSLSLLSLWLPWSTGGMPHFLILLFPSNLATSLLELVWIENEHVLVLVFVTYLLATIALALKDSATSNTWRAMSGTALSRASSQSRPPPLPSLARLHALEFLLCLMHCLVHAITARSFALYSAWTPSMVHHGKSS